MLGNTASSLNNLSKGSKVISWVQNLKVFTHFSSRDLYESEEGDLLDSKKTFLNEEEENILYNLSEIAERAWVVLTEHAKVHIKASMEFCVLGFHRNREISEAIEVLKHLPVEQKNVLYKLVIDADFEVSAFPEELIGEIFGMETCTHSSTVSPETQVPSILGVEYTEVEPS